MRHSEPRSSIKELTGTYQPRRPQETVLYQAVAANYRTFETIAELEGKIIPKHVTQEFEAFLRCGVLAHGFLRLRCNDCHHEHLLAFSCKKRGFCSSCGGRRMAESAAHLVDEVFPKAGIRQWVLSFPMPVRFILAKNPKIQTRVLAIIHRAITAYIRKKARTKGLRARLQPGAVTLIQRFGSSLNLNVHFHMLWLEGGFYETPQGPKLWWVDPPTDSEIQDMVTRLATRVVRILKKKGYFQDECDAAIPDVEGNENELLPELQAASVRSKIALGERKGKPVRRLGSLDLTDLQPVLKGSLCAQVLGFSLHAGVYCAPSERAKLEKLCRYITRPAIAENRLELKPSGEIVLKLKTPYSDGTTHLLFSGLEFVEKIAALIPPPRFHLTRFFGCLAPHSKIRPYIVPKKETPPAQPLHPEENISPQKKKKTRSYRWAEILARIFAIDMKICPRCGGEVKLTSVITEPGPIQKILTHLDLPFRPPELAPSRIYSQMSFT
jgi:hypothetical protein